MPNYSIVINSKFRPFSYDEMIKPVQAMYEQQSKIEEGLSELETKANIWEGLANEQTDEKAYKQYKKYADDLRAAADDLALNGLNASSRQNLYRMKSRYASEITPIEQAYERRAKQLEKQETLAAQDPSLIFDREAALTSLDTYMNNPALSFKAISGKQVMADVIAQASSLAKELDTTSLAHLTGNADFYEYVKKYGKTSTAVMKAIMDSPDADNVLTSLISNTVNSTGVNEWKNPDGTINSNAINKVIASAKKGLWASVGATETTITPDWRRQENLQYSHQQALQEDRQAFEAEQRDKDRDLTREQQNLQYPPVYENGKIIGRLDRTTGSVIPISAVKGADNSLTMGDAAGKPLDSGRAVSTTSEEPDPSSPKYREWLGKMRYSDLKNNEVIGAKGMETITQNFTPLVGISRHRDRYRHGNFYAISSEGKDIPHTHLGWTKSNLASRWLGDRTFDVGKNAIILSNHQINSLPVSDREAITMAAKELQFDKTGAQYEVIAVDTKDKSGKDYIIAVHNKEVLPFIGEGYKDIDIEIPITSKKEAAVTYGSEENPKGGPTAYTPYSVD